MEYKLQQTIETNWHRISKGRKPETIKFILLNKVFMVFKDKEKKPFIAIKFSENSSLEQEFINLQNINKLLPDETPMPYFYVKEGNYHLLGQVFCAGKNMSTMKITKEDVSCIFNSLIKFHKAVCEGRFCLDKQHIDELVTRPINRFLKVNPGHIIEGELNQAIKRIEEMKGSYLLYIPQHCDFSLVNIIFDHALEKLYIIDWADFGKSYLPLYDVFLMIISYYLVPDKFPGLMEKTQVNDGFIECLSAYLKHFEIDKRWIRILFPISLITFFNQNYPDRIETHENVKQLITFYSDNKNKIIFNKLF